MKRLAGTIAVLLALLGAASAPAATEVGSHCEAGSQLGVGIEGIVFPLATAPPALLPLSSPNGIATRWTVRSGSTDTFYERLKILRATPDTKTVQVIGETSLQPVVKGGGSFPIRIPVQVGDQFGLSGPFGVSVCATGSTGDVIGATASNGQPGQSESFSESSGYQLAMSVTVEPDGDRDGYGDESQDGCPEDASVQVPCPQVTLIPKAVLKKRAILVRVKVSSEASVQVFGQVGWKVPASDDRNHRLIVALNGGPVRTVFPDRIATFRLPLGKAVKRRLERLGPTQSLRANLTARVTDLAGRVTTRPVRLRLPGRG